jgi:tRNA(Ile)-lysidine synthase
MQQPQGKDGRGPGDTADPLLARVFRTIERHGMLASGDTVLAGVSGGADSVALVDILCALAPAFDIQIAVAHLDHGLRPEAAEEEAALVRRLARRLGLACHVDRLAPPGRRGSLEERLRRLRYAFFERTAAAYGYSKIAVGHHADDNAEAVLMHLLRGTGIRGLAGIPPVRDRRIVRPLIEIRRADILAYLQRRGLPFAEDTSNTDPRFERNRIRHHLIPLLQRQYNPAVVDALNRLAALCHEEEAWLRSRLEPLAADAMASLSASGVDLDARKLLAQARPVQRRLVRAALGRWQGHLRRLSADHVEALLALLARETTGSGLDLPNRVRAERTTTLLRFRRSPARNATERPSPVPAYAYKVESVGRLPLRLHVPEAGCTLLFSRVPPPEADQMPASDRHIVLLDMDRIAFPLTIRNCRAGDRLHPFGMQGTQKLKNLFINSRVPRERRRRLPLLVSGDAIVWVVGVRRGRQACLAPDTTRVLRVAVEQAGAKPVESASGR